MILREFSCLLILFLLPLTVFGAGGGECTIPDNYTTLPPEDTYALPGAEFVIVVEHNLRFDSPIPYIPGGLTNLTSPTAANACADETADTCILDINQGTLNIIDFQPRFEGSYRFRIPYGFENDEVCFVNFNLHEAIPPNITKETEADFILDTDQGLLLQPIIYHGTPPGVVRWFEDGVFRFEGDTYDVPNANVNANSRGFYNATVVQHTVNASTSVSVVYRVFVDFAPMVNLTESVQNGEVELRCDSIGHPRLDSIVISLITDGQSVDISADVQINNQVDDNDLSFSGFATKTITGSCTNQQYRCTVGNSVSSVSSTINACQTVANIIGLEVNLATTTNISIGLSWTILPVGASVSQYELEVDGQTMLLTLVGNTYYSIPGLSPGVSYSIRMRAMNSNGYGQYSAITAIPFTVPSGIPRSIDIVYDSGQFVVLEWEEVLQLGHAPVTGYDIIYHTSNNLTRVVVSVPGQLMLNLSNALEIVSGIIYFIKVRATNQWGSGSESAQVEFRLIGDPTPVRVNITLEDPVITNTMATLQWTINDTSVVEYLFIEVDRLLVRSTQANPVFYPVYQYNVTDDIKKCFSDLNSSDIYRFCVIAVLRNQQRVSACKVVSTGENTPDGSSLNCVSVLGRSGNNSSVIASWVIAVSVVVCVVLVVIFFGGCGLYFGLRKTRKSSANFDSPNQSFDKIPQTTNGYPYPPPPPRSASPGRSCVSCKSYRHNNHAHQMDWQATNPRPVETTIV